MDDSFLDGFYEGLRETYLEKGSIHRMVKNRAWNAKRGLIKLQKNSSRPIVRSVDELLSMKDLGQLSLDLFPEFLKNHPLVELPGMSYANFAGIGWLHFQRKWNKLGLAEDLPRMIQKLLDFYESFPKDVDPYILDKFNDFDDRQMLLLWFARVWGCGGQHGEHFETEETKRRKSLLMAMSTIVHKEFNCDLKMTK